MSDIGSSAYSETASSNTNSPPNGWPENMAPSGVNNSARENMAAQKRFWNRINGVKTGGGTANAQTCNWDVAESAYYAGARALVKFAATNTAPASMNFNGLGAVTMVDAAGDALVGGEVQSGAYGELMHDGTNLRLLSMFQKSGTWTPTLTADSGSATYTTNAGYYQRIGRIVFVTGYIVVATTSLSGGTTGVKINGLPYACRNVDGAESAISIWYEGVDTAGASTDIEMVGYVEKNATTIQLSAPRDAATGQQLGGGAITTSTKLRFSAMYQTTA